MSILEEMSYKHQKARLKQILETTLADLPNIIDDDLELYIRALERVVYWNDQNDAIETCLNCDEEIA